MSWWGKLAGGAFGFMLGGPLGAVLGAALGHSFDRGLDGVRDLPPGGAGVSHRERAQTAFFTATFSVMGHVAKADGRVTPSEIRLASDLMDQMGLKGDMRRAAQRLFNEGKARDFPLDAALDQLRTECRFSRNLVRMFVEIQVYAALADGSMHADERGILRHACRRLHLSDAEFRRIEAMVEAELHYQRTAGNGAADGGGRLSLDDAYALLAASPGSTDDEIKRAYRRLMSRHHPDKLVAKGLPEEMMRVATAKTQEIKLAYERIREARGF